MENMEMLWCCDGDAVVLVCTKYILQNGTMNFFSLLLIFPNKPSATGRSVVAPIAAPARLGPSPGPPNDGLPRLDLPPPM